MKIYKYTLFLLATVILFAPFLFVENIGNIFLTYAGGNYALFSLVYIFLLVASVVVAPFTMPLFLVSGGIFGPVVAALYNIIGWSIGAILAFLIARFLERSVLSRFVSLKKINEYEKKIPKEMEFWGIVLLRVVMPVDILSYALGFFSSISLVRYTIATIIGITPFAVLFAYGGSALFEGNYITIFIIVNIAVLVSLVGLYLFKKR